MKKSRQNPVLIKATIADYPVIQNMAQFYVYDASRDCGFSISDNGLYEPNNYQAYVTEPAKQAFLVKISDEIAGFLLLNEVGFFSNTERKIDQFFILAKFQGKGLGKQIAHQIWNTYPGLWEVSIIPENKAALVFWRKAIAEYTAGIYKQTEKLIDYDGHHLNRIILRFDSRVKNQTFEGKQGSSNNFNIRRLIINDLKSYFDLRLESLQNAPENFMTSYEEEKAKGFTFFQKLLDEEAPDNLIFGAFVNDALIGCIGIYQEVFLKAKHKSNIWGMYVKPAHRKHGVGKALLKQSVDYAKMSLNCSVLNITVEATNISAKTLYESFGFKEWGNESKAMMMDGLYFDECHMSLMMS